MLVLTIQKKEVIDKIYKGSYRVNMWKSEYAFASPRFTKGYNIIKSNLVRKTGSFMLTSDSCYWGWVCNPFYSFFDLKRMYNEYYAVFVDIPEEELVLSDYDKYTSFVLEESDSEDFMVEEVLPGDTRCIQCSFKELNPEDIVFISDISILSDIEGDISSVYLKSALRLQWFRLSRNSVECKVV